MVKNTKKMCSCFGSTLFFGGFNSGEPQKESFPSIFPICTCGFPGENLGSQWPRNPPVPRGSDAQVMITGDAAGTAISIGKAAMMGVTGPSKFAG